MRGATAFTPWSFLITDMQKLGASRSRLKAKIFGGATVLGFAQDKAFLCVHEVNQRFIRDYLATERIRIVSEDLGGELAASSTSTRTRTRSSGDSS